MTNIALGKTATQSTILEDASRAFDGDTNGNSDGYSISKTLELSNSWWSVNLWEPQKIQQIHVYNRADCCQRRLATFILTIHDTNGSIIWTYTHQDDFPPRVTVINGEPPVVIGLEVKITLLPERILGLPEVKVYALVEPSLCLDTKQRDDAPYLWKNHD